MLSAVKLWKSSSISGPSATAKPISPKIAITSSIVWLIGCRRPCSSGRTGSDTSTDFGGEPSFERGIVEGLLALVDRIRDDGLHRVQRLAGFPPGVRVEPAQPLHQVGDAPLAAERIHPHGVERVRVRRRRDGGKQFIP